MVSQPVENISCSLWNPQFHCHLHMTPRPLQTGTEPDESSPQSSILFLYYPLHCSPIYTHVYQASSLPSVIQPFKHIPLQSPMNTFLPHSFISLYITQLIVQNILEFYLLLPFKTIISIRGEGLQKLL